MKKHLDELLAAHRSVNRIFLAEVDGKTPRQVLDEWLPALRALLAQHGLHIVAEDDPELRESKEYLLKAQIADVEAKLAELQLVHARCRRREPADAYTGFCPTCHRSG